MHPSELVPCTGTLGSDGASGKGIAMIDETAMGQESVTGQSKHNEPVLISEETSPSDTDKKRVAKRVRMTVDFPPRTAERLDKLRELTGASTYAEVLRNALALFEIVAEAQERGASISVEGPEPGVKETIRWAHG
jgi:hypothetical protein